MGTYLVRGGKRIEGEFAVRGSKNAALPILAACVLAADEVVLENLPQIRDVSQTLEILRELGCSVTLTGRTAVIDSHDMQAAALCGEAVRKMRSSILFLGAMLGRSGVGRIAYPGGCAIGKRPIDLHLAALRRRTRFLIAGRSGCRGVGLICRFRAWAQRKTFCFWRCARRG